MAACPVFPVQIYRYILIYRLELHGILFKGLGELDTWLLNLLPKLGSILLTLKDGKICYSPFNSYRVGTIKCGYWRQL